MLSQLLDPLRHPEFLLGLVCGAVALLAAAWILSSKWRRAVVGRPARVGGLLLAAAVLAGLAWPQLLSLRLVVGLALLAGAQALGRLTRRRLRRRAAPGLLVVGAAVAGAVALTADLGPLGSAWRLVVAAASVGVAAALWEFDRRSPHAGLAPLLLLATAGGMYATVPDTEQARVLLAAALPLALLGWPRPLVRLGPTGAVLVGGLLTWVAATGGHGRPGAVVGALAAAGLLLADPVARAVAGRSLLDRVPVGAAGGAGLAVAQAGLAFAAARVAGLRESALEAALVAVPALALVALVLAVAPRPRRTLRRPTG